LKLTVLAVVAAAGPRFWEVDTAAAYRRRLASLGDSVLAMLHSEPEPMNFSKDYVGYLATDIETPRSQEDDSRHNRAAMNEGFAVGLIDYKNMHTARDKCPPREQ